MQDRYEPNYLNLEGIQVPIDGGKAKFESRIRQTKIP